MSAQVSQRPNEAAPHFRLDVQLHELLTKPLPSGLPLRPADEPQRFPDPVFPQRPELLRPIDENNGWTPPKQRHWTPGQIYHAMQGWLFPYIRSRATQLAEYEQQLRTGVIAQQQPAAVVAV